MEYAQTELAHAGACTGSLGESAVRETLSSRAYQMAYTAEAQAEALERSVSRILGGGNGGPDGRNEADKPSDALPTSLSRIQMASHRVAKCIEALGEVA